MTTPKTSSIWLIPPANSDIQNTLQTLIQETLPRHFRNESVPSFVPHLTLASGVILDGSAQEVLDGLEIDQLVEALEVVFTRLMVGCVFYFFGILWNFFNII
jgi:2'-5' RNA ligase